LPFQKSRITAARLPLQPAHECRRLLSRAPRRNPPLSCTEAAFPFAKAATVMVVLAFVAFGGHGTAIIGATQLGA